MCFAPTLLLLAALAGPALSQPVLPPGTGGSPLGLATRSVSVYLGLERTLVDSLKQGNRDAVLKQLAEGFAAYAPDTNDQGLPAQAWVDGELHRQIIDAQVRDLNVRELDDLAIVSFLLEQQLHRSGKTRTTVVYVVDIWRRTSHQLWARYVSWPAHVGLTPARRRPTGKE
ncbi:nuclear transport factor 2 family protein [Ralstonia soli]|uniref:Nuclear transport factor 2 family protein n=1 Tax=Ralstonia soli TaxID=2953896 RepID=A0ABT1AG72_9RALS|nr:nuclear transport factor 2 family protein [Ralstonia soli]MCO5397387.1 nuclear transport factor 2 family protein [Ralstonia soli]